MPLINNNISNIKGVHTSEGEYKSTIQIKDVRKEPHKQYKMNNLYRLNKITNVILFLYYSLFCPSKSTLLQAIKYNNFIIFPRLTYKNIAQYIDETITTAKGHLDKH